MRFCLVRSSTSLLHRGHEAVENIFIHLARLTRPTAISRCISSSLKYSVLCSVHDLWANFDRYLLARLSQAFFTFTCSRPCARVSFTSHGCRACRLLSLLSATGLAVLDIRHSSSNLHPICVQPAINLPSTCLQESIDTLAIACLHLAPSSSSTDSEVFRDEHRHDSATSLSVQGRTETPFCHISECLHRELHRRPDSDLPGMRTPPPSVVLEWPEPNYDNPATRGSALLAINLMFIALMVIAVAGRFYSRIVLKKWYGIDDTMMAFGLVLPRPVQAYWDVYLSETGHCLDEGTITISAGVINCIADLLTTVLPIPVIVKLQMPLKQRCGVCLLLCLGFIVTIAGIVRTYFIWKSLVDSWDESWFSYPLWICATVELDLAVPLLQRPIALISSKLSLRFSSLCSRHSSRPTSPEPGHSSSFSPLRSLPWFQVTRLGFEKQHSISLTGTRLYTHGSDIEMGCTPFPIRDIVNHARNQERGNEVASRLTIVRRKSFDQNSSYSNPESTLARDSACSPVIPVEWFEGVGGATAFPRA
nr:hypothetical protein CFP56_58176 [Quercus suber]